MLPTVLRDLRFIIKGIGLNRTVILCFLGLPVLQGRQIGKAGFRSFGMTRVLRVDRTMSVADYSSTAIAVPLPLQRKAEFLRCAQNDGRYNLSVLRRANAVRPYDGALTFVGTDVLGGPRMHG